MLPQHSPRIILDHIADQNAVGRKRARHDRNENLRNAQCLRQVASVQATSPAESNQRKTPRIVAAFDRDHAQRPLHVGIHHPDDAFRELLQ